MRGPTADRPRFRGVNVLSFDLDMPERTTADYEASGVNPNVRAALTAGALDRLDTPTSGAPM